MNIEYLSTVVAMLLVLSIASERLVEIIKGFVPFLSVEQQESGREFRRTAYLQILAVVAGIVTALLARKAIKSIVPELNTTTGILALGLLASGGSGLWNSILGYASEVKKIKKKDREKK